MSSLLLPSLIVVVLRATVYTEDIIVQNPQKEKLLSLFSGAQNLRAMPDSQFFFSATPQKIGADIRRRCNSPE
ncbi:hypothetical protein MRB53_016461 [Persea americana]|uniref:Uncharacterized protein n=1 Tax=Persea americana TaxID=3435 RepID=A0ACC2M3J9_PERAE|nr:hypothetical protein MRB53_016461 [Persea americana]